MPRDPVWDLVKLPPTAMGGGGRFVSGSLGRYIFILSDIPHWISDSEIDDSDADPDHVNVNTAYVCREMFIL